MIDITFKLCFFAFMTGVILSGLVFIFAMCLFNDWWNPAHSPSANRGDLRERVAELESERDKLRVMICGLADRIAAQSELLSRKAQR